VFEPLTAAAFNTEWRWWNLQITIFIWCEWHINISNGIKIYQKIYMSINLCLINVILKMNQTENFLSRFCLGLPYQVWLISVRQPEGCYLQTDRHAKINRWFLNAPRKESDSDLIILMLCSIYINVQKGNFDAECKKILLKQRILWKYLITCSRFFNHSCVTIYLCG
jgi:hypothetical protein